MTRLFKYHVPSGSGMEEVRDALTNAFVAPTRYMQIQNEFRDETGMSLVGVQNVMLQAVPTITTLALLGYDTSAVEFERHTATIREDLSSGNLLPTKTSKPAPDGLEPHRIRLYLHKVSSANAPPPIAISEQDVDAYVVRLGAWYNTSMHDIHDLYATNGSGAAIHHEWAYGTLPETTEFITIVHRNLMAFVRAGFDGPVTLETGLASARVIPNFDVDTMDFAVPRVLGELALAPVAAFLQWRLGQEADKWFRADPANDVVHPPGVLPPGRLAILDPEQWRDGARVTTNSLNPEERSKMLRGMQYIKKSYGLILKAMGKSSFIGAQGPEDPGGRYFDKVGQHYYMAGLSSFRSEPQRKALPPDAERAVSAASALVQRLADSAYMDNVVQVFQDAEEDPREPDYVEMIEGRTRHPDSMTAGATLGTLLAMARQFDQGQFLRFPYTRARKTASEAYEMLRLLGATEGTQGYVYGRIERDDYFAGLNAMMQFGLFSVDHLLGLPGPDEDALEPEYDIIAEEITGEPGKIRLTLPDYVHEGIVLSLTHAGLGYTLQEAVNWTYIPPPEVLPTETLQEARRRMGGNNNPKIAIVAAPGVQIERRQWPASVDMEVFRVQDIGFVPPPDTPINPLAFSSTRSIPISEIIRPEQLAADQALSQLWDELQPDVRFHNVVIQPLNVPASIPDGPLENPIMTGESILIKGSPTGVYEELGREYRGPTANAAIHLEVDALSGTDRFCYELYPRVAIEGRQGAPNADEVMVPYIGIEVAVHGTTQFNSHAVRDNVGRYGDLLVNSLTAGFWQASGPDALLNVGPPGTLLELENSEGARPVANQRSIGAWVAMGPNQTSAPAQSTAPLTFHDHPFDEAFWDYFWESTVFWGQLGTDVGIGFIPIVGDAVDVLELAVSLYTGTDKWGQPVSHTQQLMMLGGVLLPFVSSGALKGLAEVVDPNRTDDYLGAIRDAAP